MWLRFHREIWRTRMQIVLIRHCVNDAVERVLCGRTLDVSLNAIGRRQAELLGAALAEDEPVLQCSPRRRTHEPAMYIAQRNRKSVGEGKSGSGKVDIGG